MNMYWKVKLKQAYNFLPIPRLIVLEFLNAKNLTSHWSFFNHYHYDKKISNIIWYNLKALNVTAQGWVEYLFLVCIGHLTGWTNKVYHIYVYIHTCMYICHVYECPHEYHTFQQSALSTFSWKQLCLHIQLLTCHFF